MNINSYLKKLEKKDQRRKPKMRVEGRSVFKTKELKQRKDEKVQSKGD